MEYEIIPLIKNFMKIHDVTLIISESMIVWPGHTKPKIEVKSNKAADDVSLTKFTLISHHGTHVDAPLHFIRRGESVDEIATNKLVGPCRVLDMTAFFKGTSGAAEIGRAHFERHKVKKGERLIIKTGNYKLLHADRFTSEYISLSKDAAKFLTERGILFIGVDYFGIEKKGNPEHPVHKMFLKSGVVICEGLDLGKIVAGEYTLICAPLKLSGADGSPARVFLLEE